MNNVLKIRVWMLFLATALLLLLFFGIRDSVAFSQPKFEYQAAFVKGSNLQTDLNKAGRVGWELVNARFARGDNEEWGYEIIMIRRL